MKLKLCDIPAIPQDPTDKSGIGVHYVDAFIKLMNVKLEDGTPVRCKRRGLKLLLSVGPKKGEALLRRIEHGPDPVTILPAALHEAAARAGVTLELAADAVYLIA